MGSAFHSSSSASGARDTMPMVWKRTRRRRRCPRLPPCTSAIRSSIKTSTCWSGPLWRCEMRGHWPRAEEGERRATAYRRPRPGGAAMDASWRSSPPGRRRRCFPWRCRRLVGTRPSPWGAPSRRGSVAPAPRRRKDGAVLLDLVRGDTEQPVESGAELHGLWMREVDRFSVDAGEGQVADGAAPAPLLQHHSGGGANPSSLQAPVDTRFHCT